MENSVAAPHQRGAAAALDPGPATLYISAIMSIGTKLFTYFRGQLVGSDSAGNRYYRERGTPRAGVRQRRWVMFADGIEEASAVPPEWHAWLHHTIDAPLSESARKPWQKPHQPNLTGTAQSYRPSGHALTGGARPPASVDYEAWTPGA